MAFDGIVTNRIVNELKNIIGYKVDKVFQPNKNTVILGLYKASTSLALLSCISSNNYRLHLTTHQFKNPTTAPNFCMLLRKHLTGLKIKDIYTTQNLERIVFIDFENNENPNKPIQKKLIIELMGKHSNMILTNENNIIIDSLRHTYMEEHSQRDIYPTCRYILPQTSKFNLLDIKTPEEFYNVISNSDYSLPQNITNAFNGISNSFVESLSSMTDQFKENIFLIYHKIFKILNSDDLCFTHQNKDYVLSLSDPTDKIYNLNFFLDDFYYQKETNENFITLKNNIYNIVINTQKKYTKRLENINKKLSECNDMDKFKLYGELITSNLYRIPNKHINNISLENYYDNNSLIDIPLNEKYSPSYNAKQYFKKYSKLKNALDILNNQKIETLKDLNYIDSVLFELENSSNLNELNLINDEISDSNNINIFSTSNKYNKKSLKNKKSSHKFLSKSSPSYFNPIFLMVEDYKVYVGRNNKENDYLTTKFANKHDIWFHTKDTPGSHVILKTNPNEVIPDNILFEVAKIAASHSKAKNSSNIPVDFCLVSFVKKPNNSKPGFVIYKNNKTIIV